MNPPAGQAPVPEIDREPRVESPSDAAPSPVFRVSRTMRIVGEVSAAVDVSIDGQFVGKLRLDDNRLTTGAASRVTADIFARNVLLRGRVEGNVTAKERVTLAPTAEVHGTIEAPYVTLRDGCRLVGRIVKSSAY